MSARSVRSVSARRSVSAKRRSVGARRSVSVRRRSANARRSVSAKRRSANAKRRSANARRNVNARRSANATVDVNHVHARTESVTVPAKRSVAKSVPAIASRFFVENNQF